MEKKQFTPRPRLVEMRNKAGLSQEKAGAAIGGHRNTIVKLETGEMALTDAYMSKLAEAYGCDPWELLEGAPILKPEIKQIMKEMETINIDRLRAMLTLVKQP